MAEAPEGPPGSSGGNDWMRAIREVAPYLDLGWRIAVATVVTVGGGVWLDQWLGTLPLFTIGGILLGLAGAFVQIARLNPSEPDDEQPSPQPDSDAGPRSRKSP